MPRIDSTPSSEGVVESIRHAPLLGLFFLNGLLASSWVARLPAVRDALDLTPAAFGVILPLGAIGAIAGVSVVHAVLARLGGVRTLVASTVAHALAFALLGIGPAIGSTSLLIAGLVLNGAAFSLGNLPLNVESAGLERRSGRAILPRFHGAFSLGTVFGSVVGVVCAATGVAVQAQFFATAVLAVLWRVAALPHVVHDTRRSTADAPPQAPVSDRDAPKGVPVPGEETVSRGTAASWREGRILLLGLIVLSASITEGAANDWLSLAVVDGFGWSDAAGAAVFGVFVASMTAVRLAGTWITQRWGRVATLRGSAVLAVVGIVLFATAPILPLAVLGVAAWGGGTGLVVPLVISAASEDPVRAAGRVAVVTGAASLASLLGPPVLGLAGSLVGPRLALIILVAVVAVMLGLSRRVAPSMPRASSHLVRPRLVRHRESLTFVRARRLTARSDSPPITHTHRENVR